MADDVDLADGMENWTDDQIRAYFDSGGEDKPAPVADISDAAPVAKASGPKADPAALSKFLADNGLNSLEGKLPADTSVARWLIILGEDGFVWNYR